MAYGDATATGEDARVGSGIAVVAVGGYGRRELAPYGDIDVVLVHEDRIAEAEIARIASALWYPLWDAGLRLDHAVRSAPAMREAARADVKTAMGWLDARTVAGDTGLVLGLRSGVLADWRGGSRRAIESLRRDRDRRHERSGWLAYEAMPDLKASAGGMRDAVVLRGLMATWLVDAPMAQVEPLRAFLLDVRDVLHTVAGRPMERLDPQFVPEVAAQFDMAPGELQVAVRDAGRRLDHLARLTWRRLDQALALSASRSRRQAVGRVPMAPGIARDGDGVTGEIVLAARADRTRDPVLGLRAAAVAARSRLLLSPATVAALAAADVGLGPRWDDRARRAMVDLLSSGPGLVDVWHQLDVAGLVDRWLPEWAGIRLRGSSSPVHRFTIDRHSIETCVQARAHIRRVERPDLLMVAALLHDIGKSRDGDHSEVGAPMAHAVAMRWGFSSGDADVIAELVRWHLLLPTVATGRDIEDPGTAANVAHLVRTEAFLDLLAALTFADGAATSSQAGSRWRRRLIEALVTKVRLGLAGEHDPDRYEGWPEHVPFPSTRGVGALRLEVEAHLGGSLLTIVTPDRPGVLANIAGALALAGVDLHSLRTVTRDGYAVSLWETPRADLDTAAVTERVRRALAGDLDLDVRLDRPAKGDDDPQVRILARAHVSATMIEVRALDRRGLVYLVARAVRRCGFSIRSAHVSTFGPEARDVFYVVDKGGDALDVAAAEVVRQAVSEALG
ncbi:MAG: [protein-PII] uridylyltransferase [Aeromicrobium sp.]|uniref:[protein-PII] uridylyltransferase n=1 Tax=Aeromicrobium sp. TaxID=1871063 RepID=UPI0039E3D71D